MLTVISYLSIQGHCYLHCMACSDVASTVLDGVHGVEVECHVVSGVD